MSVDDDGWVSFPSESHRMYTVQRKHAVHNSRDWSATEPNSAHLPEQQQQQPEPQAHNQ